MISFISTTESRLFQAACSSGINSFLFFLICTELVWLKMYVNQCSFKFLVIVSSACPCSAGVLPPSVSAYFHQTSLLYVLFQYPSHSGTISFLVFLVLLFLTFPNFHLFPRETGNNDIAASWLVSQIVHIFLIPIKGHNRISQVLLYFFFSMS